MLYCCNQNKSCLCVVYLFIPDIDKIKYVVYIYFDAETYLYCHVQYHDIFPFTPIIDLDQSLALVSLHTKYQI